MNQNNVYQAAVHYLELELPIIPLCSVDHQGMSDKHKERCKTPGKAPILKQWSKHTHTTREELDGWFQQNGHINLGLVLGNTKDWNLVGVDINGALGEKTWQDLLLKHKTPDTWEFKTGGGRRLLYVLPEGLKTKKKKVCWSEGHEELAFLAQGQQTVMPPSKHASGNNYMWIEGRSPKDIDIESAPDWIIDLIGQFDEPSLSDIESIPNFYGEPLSAPTSIQEFSNTTAEGSRSDYLTRFVGSLCADKSIPQDTVLMTALQQNIIHCDPPLTTEEVTAMVGSIFESEQRKRKARETRIKRRTETTPRVAAELFHKQLEEKGVFLTYFLERDQFYSTTFKQGPWTIVNPRYIVEQIETMLHELDPQAARKNRILEVMDALKSRLCRIDDGSDLDIGRSPNLKYIITEDGMLDWEANELVPWDPKILTTLLIHAKWSADDDADYTKAEKAWQAALHSWVDEEDTMKFLQEYIGYCLLPTCGMRTATFLYGDGANGKSLFLDIIAELFEGHVTHTQPAALARTRDR